MEWLSKRILAYFKDIHLRISKKQRNIAMSKVRTVGNSLPLYQCMMMYHFRWKSVLTWDMIEFQTELTANVDRNGETTLQ
jgi:hypothetical protein